MINTFHPHHHPHHYHHLHLQSHFIITTLICRLPDDYSFESESEIDADIDVYRNSLKRVIVSLIRMYPSGYLDFIDEYFVNVTPEQFALREWQEAEAILTFVYYFGDGENVNLNSSAFRGRSLDEIMYYCIIVLLYFYFSISIHL